MLPAKTLREAYQATDPRPLPSGDPYFVDLSKARDSRATEHLRRMIENCDRGRYSAIAFSGHRGSGKSTELRQLQTALGTSCFILYLDVNEFLDTADVDYTDLFLLLSRRLLDELRDQQIVLSQHLLNAVEGWFKSVTKETEESLMLSAGVSAEASAGVEIPFIAKLLAKLTADVKAGSSRKETTREELDRYFSGLLANTNTLLAAASEALHKAGKPDQVLIVVDNLDRLPPDKSERLFFSHGSQLQDLQCHAVYTVSIDTYYSHRGIGHVFSNHLLLPNVKLRLGKTRPEPNPDAIRGLSEVISHRVDVTGLLNPATLTEDPVRWSGGSVRQLVRLLREAVLSAQSRGLAALDRQAMADAVRTLQHDFERSLGPEDYKLLALTSSHKSIEKSEAYMQLLSNTAVMEYNGGEVWYDVNPLIEPIDAFQAAKAKSSGTSGARRHRRK